MRKVWILLAVILALLLASAAFLAFNTAGFFEAADTALSSQRIVVPTDYPTIEDAVGNATEGATIYVQKGVYPIKANPLVINKTLTIQGEDQIGTILQTPPDTRFGFAFLMAKIGISIDADDFSISNLTIKGADYGVYASGNRTEFRNITTSSLLIIGSYCQISGTNLTGTENYLLTASGSFNNVSGNLNAAISINGHNNTVAANRDSFQICISGDNNTVTGNPNSVFIALTEANQNLIEYNQCSMLELTKASHNTVRYNVFCGGKTTGGIQLGSGSGNIFYANNITGYNDVSATNGRRYGFGVTIGEFDNTAEKNIFYCNNFMLNYKDVSANWEVLGQGNRWDNGSFGNYWDTYIGIDSNGDGVSDASYTINGLSGDTNGNSYSHVFGVDRYPLIAPFNWSKAR